MSRPHVRSVSGIIGKPLRSFIVFLLLTMIICRLPFVLSTCFEVISVRRAVSTSKSSYIHCFSFANDDHKFASTRFWVISVCMWYIGKPLFIHRFSLLIMIMCRFSFVALTPWLLPSSGLRYSHHCYFLCILRCYLTFYLDTCLCPHREVLPFYTSFSHLYCLLRGSACLDSRFAPMWGGSAIFVLAFADFVVYLEVLRVWTQDLCPCGEVLPFLYQVFLIFAFTWRFCVFGLRIYAHRGRFCHFCTSFFRFLCLLGGSACLDSGFAPMWGGSAIFVLAFWFLSFIWRFCQFFPLAILFLW